MAARGSRKIAQKCDFHERPRARALFSLLHVFSLHPGSNLELSQINADYLSDSVYVLAIQDTMVRTVTQWLTE